VTRPKFNAYVSLDQRLSQVRRLSGLVEPVKTIRHVMACRDPKDNMLLEIAINGRASHIVTGDNDLLALNPFEGVQIVAPAVFVRAVSSAKRSSC